MRRLFLSAFLVLVLAPAAIGQAGWVTGSGRRAPDTAARKSVDGFGGWLLATSDVNWREKWETPTDTIPWFNEARTVRRGQKISVLTFYTNPRLSRGDADVTCDIDILRPNGTSVHFKDAECYRGAIREDAKHVFLSKQVVDFVGEEHDPPGRWAVRITLRDNVRHVVLPLSTSFVLK